MKNNITYEINDCCSIIENDFSNSIEDNILYNYNNIIFSNRCGILFHELY